MRHPLYIRRNSRDPEAVGLALASARLELASIYQTTRGRSVASLVWWLDAKRIERERAHRIIRRIKMDDEELDQREIEDEERRAYRDWPPVRGEDY